MKRWRICFPPSPFSSATAASSMQQCKSTSLQACPRQSAKLPTNHAASTRSSAETAHERERASATAKGGDDRRELFDLVRPN